MNIPQQLRTLSQKYTEKRQKAKQSVRPPVEYKQPIELPYEINHATGTITILDNGTYQVYGLGSTGTVVLHQDTVVLSNSYRLYIQAKCTSYYNDLFGGYQIVQKINKVEQDYYLFFPTSVVKLHGYNKEIELMSLKQSTGELLIAGHSEVNKIAKPLYDRLKSLLEEQPPIHHHDIRIQFVKKLNSEIASYVHEKLADKGSYEDVLILLEEIRMPVALGYMTEKEFENDYK